jgi:hypothetical protein
MTVRFALAFLLVAALGCGSDTRPSRGVAGDDRVPAGDPVDTSGDTEDYLSASGDRGDGVPAGAPADDPVGGWTAGIVDLPATDPSAGVATLRDLRWAGHDGYERVTFEFEGSALPAVHLEYIDRPVRQCGSGNPTPIAGDGWLEVLLSGAAAHTEAGEPTITPRESFPQLGNLREVEITCDFEAEVVVVLGVGSPNRYRTLVLEQPARLAVDIRR